MFMKNACCGTSTGFSVNKVNRYFFLNSPHANPHTAHICPHIAHIPILKTTTKSAYKMFDYYIIVLQKCKSVPVGFVDVEAFSWIYSEIVFCTSGGDSLTDFRLVM